MKFNDLVNVLLKEDSFNAPVETRRPRKAATMANHGTINPLFGNKGNPAAYSGFKGDSRNPAMVVAVFPLPRKLKKIKKR